MEREGSTSKVTVELQRRPKQPASPGQLGPSGTGLPIKSYGRQHGMSLDGLDSASEKIEAELGPTQISANQAPIHSPASAPPTPSTSSLSIPTPVPSHYSTFHPLGPSASLPAMSQTGTSSPLSVSPPSGVPTSISPPPGANLYNANNLPREAHAQVAHYEAELLKNPRNAEALLGWARLLVKVARDVIQTHTSPDSVKNVRPFVVISSFPSDFPTSSCQWAAKNGLVFVSNGHQLFYSQRPLPPENYSHLQAHSSNFHFSLLLAVTGRSPDQGLSLRCMHQVSRCLRDRFRCASFHFDTSVILVCL